MNLTKNEVASVLKVDVPRNHKDEHFKGQQANEEVICFFRQHWVVLLAPILAFVFIAALSILIVSAISFNLFFEENPFLYRAVFFAVFIGMTLYSHYFFLTMINYFLNVVIITDQRVVDIKKSIYLHHDLDAIDLSQVQDVIKRQNGLMRNILSYGNLIITLAATASTKTLTYVPRADFHFRVINRCIQSARKGVKIRTHHGLKARTPEEEKKFLEDLSREIGQEEAVN